MVSSLLKLACAMLFAAAAAAAAAAQEAERSQLPIKVEARSSDFDYQKGVLAFDGTTPADTRRSGWGLSDARPGLTLSHARAGRGGMGGKVVVVGNEHGLPFLRQTCMIEAVGKSLWNIRVNTFCK
jgi:hypothetical protein